MGWLCKSKTGWIAHARNIIGDDVSNAPYFDSSNPAARRAEQLAYEAFVNSFLANSTAGQSDGLSLRAEDQSTLSEFKTGGYHSVEGRQARFSNAAGAGEIGRAGCGVASVGSAAGPFKR